MQPGADAGQGAAGRNQRGASGGGRQRVDRARRRGGADGAGRMAGRSHGRRCLLSGAHPPGTRRAGRVWAVSPI